MSTYSFIELPLLYEVLSHVVNHLSANEWFITALFNDIHAHPLFSLHNMRTFIHISLQNKDIRLE